MMKKENIKKQLLSIFKSMDFVSNNFLNKDHINKKEHQIYFNIYQQLGLAWEFLGLQCKHWDGYKKTRNQKEVCKICGKVKNIDDNYFLLSKDEDKILGINSKPNSKTIFKNKTDAKIVNDSISFHGVLVHVDVHNAYKSQLFKEHKINLAAERIVTLKERGIECYIDRHQIQISINKSNRKTGKQKFGNFPWEIQKKDLKNFPVIFEFDNDYKFLGLTIFN